jgi:hypothetical protein
MTMIVDIACGILLAYGIYCLIQSLYNFLMILVVSRRWRQAVAYSLVTFAGVIVVLWTFARQ